MAASGKAGKKRLRFGYDGCGTDLIVLIVIAVACGWGITRWNAAPHRLFGLPKIPLPAAVHALSPNRWRSWASHLPLIGGRFAPPPSRNPRMTAPAPTPTATPSAAIPAPTPTPVSTPTAATPAPAPSATPTPDTPPAPKEPTPAPAVLSITKIAPQISVSATPLQASASVMTQREGTLYLGLLDGGIVIRPRSAAKGTVVGMTPPCGAVRALAVGKDHTVWWLAGDKDDRVYCYRESDKSLRAFDVPTGPPGSGLADGLAILPGGKAGIVALLQSGGTTHFFDAQTGRVLSASDVFPDKMAEEVQHPATSLYASTSNVLVVSGDGVAPGEPARLSLWHTSGGSDAFQQVPLGSNESGPAFSQLRSGPAAISLSPEGGVALLGNPAGGQTLAACRIWTATDDARTNLRPISSLPEGVFGLWAAPDRISLGKSGLWWTFGGTVFHQATSTKNPITDCYLPWNLANGKGQKVAALLADETGAWVASDAGVRHITPGSAPNAQIGYDGYVRARLGNEAAHPPANPFGTTLDRLTKEWKGTPYHWGGDSRSGIDCSGYVCQLYKGVGVALPRQTTELANGTSGKRIHDELHYGDVLVFPGHCALYTGNGFTSEAMTDSGVGQAAIWSRKNVIVRRFH